MFKKLRNALFALTALLSFTALAATPNTVSAASSSKYTPKYVKRQVVLQLNCNSYVYDRYGNRMPWFSPQLPEGRQLCLHNQKQNCTD
ncbi:hypothetical protein ME802_12620 [Lactobacillus delbrueckii]|nr:hypothetical protein ME802_12620 [Lactobacillus delbrueckii]